MEWEELATKIKTQDEDELKAGLNELQIQAASSTLDNEPTNVLMPLCMEQLQHHDIETRGLALNIIANQLRAKNWALERMVSDIAKKLAQPNLLDMKSGKSLKNIHGKLHQDLVYTITEIHSRHPSKLMPVFKPVVNYLIDATASSNSEVSTLACMFWGNLKTPPVSQKHMGDWLPPVFHRLNKLVFSLLKCMIYHKDYVQYLDSMTHAAGEQLLTPSKEIEHMSDMRNFAALGFEKICHIFSTEVTPIFKQYVQKWIQSSNWLEQEAIVLALAAYCQALDGPTSLKDLLADTMARLLEFYQSKHPMLRSITCFTMVRFINVRPRGLKDSFGRMLRGTIALINDENSEVKDQAMRSLASLLAYSMRDLTPYSRKIVSAMQKANMTTYGQSRNVYYECIGHTVASLIPALEDRDIATLIKPLLEKWHSLLWQQEVQGMVDEMTSLCSSLCAIATHAKGKIAEHNETIVDKIAGFLTSISKNKLRNDKKSDLITAHVVAYLDLISCLYEGQGSGLNDVINRNQIPSLLNDLLQCSDQYREEVAQSTIALFGHICNYNYSEVTPILDALLESMSMLMESKLDNVRSNVLWTLSQICKNCNEKNDRLMEFGRELTSVFMNLNAHEGAIIHSAKAFMLLTKKWPNAMLKILFREEVFTHLCALLQTRFSQEQDKMEIFTILCLMISQNMQRVPKETWIHFCAAAAVLDVQDDKLRLAIKSILREVRTTVGNALWNKINTMLGQQMAYNMRKKYKLY